MTKMMDVIVVYVGINRDLRILINRENFPTIKSYALQALQRHRQKQCFLGVQAMQPIGNGHLIHHPLQQMSKFSIA